LRAGVDDRRAGAVHLVDRPLLRPRAYGTANERQERQRADCGLRISDCGFDGRSPNPQSVIHNPQLVHGFHVPLATAGTNVSTPLGGNSSVFPCSALMYAVMRTFTTSTPSSNVSCGASRPRNTRTKWRSSAS